MLFTLARELLGKAVEHAGASRIVASLHPAEEGIALALEDDGAGMAEGRAAEALRKGHIGLASVGERAAAVGGSVEIDSELGRGTRVEVQLPV